MNNQRLIKRLSGYPNQRLTGLLLAEKGNPGWTNTRAVYLLALKQVMKDKGLILA